MHAHFDSLFETFIKSWFIICIINDSNMLMRCTKRAILGICSQGNLCRCFLSLEVNIKAECTRYKYLFAHFFIYCSCIAIALCHQEPAVFPFLVFFWIFHTAICSRVSLPYKRDHNKLHWATSHHLSLPFHLISSSSAYIFLSISASLFSPALLHFFSKPLALSPHHSIFSLFAATTSCLPSQSDDV